MARGRTYAGSGAGTSYPALANGRSGGSASPIYGQQGQGYVSITMMQIQYSGNVSDLASILGNGKNPMYQMNESTNPLYQGSGPTIENRLDPRLDPKYFARKSRDSPLYSKMRSGNRMRSKSYNSQQEPGLLPISGGYDPLKEEMARQAAKTTDYADSSMSGLGMADAGAYNPKTMTSTAGFTDSADDPARQIKNKYRQKWKEYQRARNGIPLKGEKAASPLEQRVQLEQMPLAV